MNELAARIEKLSRETPAAGGVVSIIGEHPSFLEKLQRLENFARYDMPMLITGETGVGKELFARAHYLLGTRRGKPFVLVNCPQFQQADLSASELFGHKKGSFTGAVDDHRGLVETAAGGAVFLDEIGDLASKTQVMLLRFLSDGQYSPVGSNQMKNSDVQVIAATNLDLQTMVAEGKFRQDLYYRLRCFTVRIPPLRERGGDVPLLIEHAVKELNNRYHLLKKFSPSATETLSKYSWLGNIRELRSIVALAFSRSQGDLIQPQDFQDELTGNPDHTAPSIQCSGSADKIPDTLLQQMEQGDACFWQTVHAPFINRDLNRGQVRQIIKSGLAKTRNSYKHLLPLLGLKDSEYLKFMDFLRHHQLKPED
ncbi:MAG: sigma 54-interacting transcriptional regulator [Verrucomicrobiae bacterium]|nr:sigma 54-interacting transcriptional regulator [Verrucomicrobiae bacterium]